MELRMENGIQESGSGVRVVLQEELAFVVPE
jgi:hypothetical protein